MVFFSLKCRFLLSKKWKAFGQKFTLFAQEPCRDGKRTLQGYESNPARFPAKTYNALS